MSRAINGTIHKDKRKKILKMAKGYWGRRHNLYRTAKDAVAKAHSYAYRDRKAKKRSFRSLWIARLSAACIQEGVRYSKFMHALSSSGIIINRKVLANMAIEDQEAFRVLVQKVASK